MLQTHDLHVTLDAEAGLVRALDGLSLTLERGETFALVGESGCGKSMTALALMRLLPDNGRIEQGQVDLGTDVPDGKPTELLYLPECEMRRIRGGHVGIIFQEPATSLNPVMRVGDQIVEAIEAHTRLRGAAARHKAVDWLRRVGIPEPERRIDSYPFEMSGGQKQRVMIAMTLAAEPRYLIADEPTTALDVTIQKQVLDLLKALQQERQLGLLLITHDLGVVADMAHRVALMYAGQIIEEAPAATFFAQPRHPYARMLLQALPDAERRGEPLVTIGGTVPPLWQTFVGCRFAPRCDRAQDRCREQAPSLDAAAGDQGAEVRCWYPLSQDDAVVRQPAGGSGRAAEAAPQPVATTGDAQAPSPLLLDVQSLSVIFRSGGGLFRKPHEVAAVQDVSFSLRAGQTLALVGESGCGKTTTGRAIVQLLRGQPQVRVSGQVWLHQGPGRDDLLTMPAAALRSARQAIQMVFQDPFASLNPRMRVADILEEGMRSLRSDWSAERRLRQVVELVERVGLRSDALQRFPHEFSGGQRQRLAIARALAVEPQVLVCDEPTSALDVSVQAQILNLLRELQSQLGLSLLFITHNMSVVAYLADQVAVMQSGRIVEQGDTQQVLERPQHAYTRTLLSAVPAHPSHRH
ncbi:MAG: ABC transporter ATP-binding protein [Aquabacterium sp.]|jgi:peptide/nickel transport system ATP-binding protein|uniref:ABC transporter ATP-binding protein n=1 Tax=Aquabacterium sp. TaxID=1872578 RepID=UPI002A36F44C|nr:ABC transporter ATP-binding protein [Aquabacterium sp.]MDX9842682.1 ABC transporter ATP-binding protein [Aquabacterium sp.]